MERSVPINAYRDIPQHFTRNSIDRSLLTCSTNTNATIISNGNITICRPALTTASVQRRRVIKKHIQQKYLLCGFVIHAFLATPAYLYGNVVESDKNLVLRIWPAIVYQATGQLCRSIFEQIDTQYHGSDQQTSKYRHFFLLATFIICVSLMVSGIFFSSAWVKISVTTQAIAIIFYGFFAGIGSSLFIWRTHVILEAVRPSEDKFVRKTIHLCGEAFCQLFLSFAFTNLRTLYGTAQSIVLMSAMLVNLIPISLIITRHREGVTSRRISLINTDGGFPRVHYPSGHYSNTFVDQLDGIELRNWKNPVIDHNVNSTNDFTTTTPNKNNYYEEMDISTFINPNGVEIMEIIPEEDENISVIRSSSAIIDNYDKIIETLQATPKKTYSNDVQISKEKNMDRFSNSGKMLSFSRVMSTYLWSNLLDKVGIPLHHAVFVPELYSTTFLLSADVFSYVMCLTVLPGLSVSHHSIKNAEIPFLFSLLAFPWMCFSLMTPRFGNSLYKQKYQWHTLGCICKSFALVFISFSTSKLLLSVSAALLGFGQSVTLFLQDCVFQMSMTRSHWISIRHSVHFTNGLLILIWGALAHLIVVHYSFQASVGLAAVLYGTSILCCNLIFLHSNNKK